MGSLTNRPLPFYKMVASGNDFVVIDNRSGRVKDLFSFTRKICARHTGVGADGVLFYGKSRRAPFKMRIVNSDGSEAEACGNGFRCMARYAHEVRGLPARFCFETLSGIVSAEVLGNRVKILMPVPKGLEQDQTLRVGGRRLRYAFLNTGVPHAVIFVQGLESVEVRAIGRAVREHSCFKPRGTNVNFVEILDKTTIRVRTYERGVEDETLACGTGSTASAIISALKGYVHAPVRVQTRGGEILGIDFSRQGLKIRDVTLEGEAGFVCEGKYLKF